MLKKTPRFRRWILIVWMFLFIASSVKLLFDWKTGTGSFGIGLPADMVTFSSDLFGYTIKYPLSWKIVELPHGNHGDQDVVSIINFVPRDYPSVFILRKSFPDGNQEQLLQWAENWARKRKGVREFSSLPVTTKNYNGQLIEYTFSYDLGPFGKSIILCKNYSFLINTNGYLLSFCSEKDLWNVWGPTQMEMLDSFNAR